MVGRNTTILQDELAIVMKRQPMSRCIWDREAPAYPGDKVAGRPLQHPDRRVGVGIDDIKTGVVAIGDELLAPVDTQ